MSPAPDTLSLCTRCVSPGHSCRFQLLRLFEYWRNKRADRHYPSRADIDPNEIRDLLPHVYLLDVFEAPPYFRYRLAGSNVDEIHGQSLTGKSPRDIKTPEIAAAVEQQYRTAAESGQPRCDHVSLLSADGSYWHFERLILPLSDDGSRINMFLCGIYET